MQQREATATWNGTIGEGSGQMRFGEFEGEYSAPSRFENAQGTNPEELLGAAHAGCFSMQLSALLTRAGFTPERIETTASVSIEKGDAGWGITSIALTSIGTVPNIDEATFLEHANQAKDTCPVSKALSATEITLKASLAS